VEIAAADTHISTPQNTPGAYSIRGGAIAFPIFTKLLHIAPYDAQNFSLAIQSVGMGAASLSILYLRVPIERPALLYAGVPGIASIATAEDVQPGRPSASMPT